MERHLTQFETIGANSSATQSFVLHGKVVDVTPPNRFSMVNSKGKPLKVVVSETPRDGGRNFSTSWIRDEFLKLRVLVFFKLIPLGLFWGFWMDFNCLGAFSHDFRAAQV